MRSGSDKFKDECGVVAIHNHPEAATLAYLGLHALQHRGQESAGIVSSDERRLYTHKAMGLVADIFTEEVLARLPGRVAIGHTRYSTTGDSTLFNAQPITVDCNKGMIALAHNGNLVNAHFIRQKLEQQGSIFQTTSDTEVVVHLIAQSKEQTLPEAIADALRRIEGAFSLVLMSRDRVFAVRDPRPEGISSRMYAPKAPQSSCIFEHVYFSRPDSTVFGRPVVVSREALGRQLAREAPVEADMIVPVPDSGVTAAMGYSAESGIPFRFGLIRNHYVGRTFIEPEQSVRDFGVKLKLNPVRSLLEGKRVIVIDDSIVRGTTSKKIVRMLRNAGAREVHFRISCPPTVSPCFYGVDTPSKKQLIGANKSVEEIRQFIGSDSLAYLSLDGLKLACGEGEQTSYCTACYTGKYPTQWIDVEEIQPANTVRE